MYGKAEIGGNFEITELYTAFRRDYKTGYYFSGEFHDFWEIVIVLSGEIGITAGSRVMRLSRGQCVLHCPSEFHRIWNDNSLHPQIIIFSFSCRNMPEMQSRFFSVSDELLAEAEATLGEIIASFERSGISVVGIKNMDSIDYLAAAKKLELFILHVLSGNSSDIKTAASQTAKNYSAIIRAIEENLDKNIGIAELAEICRMSEVNLKKTFARYGGGGVKAYYNRMRMNKAVALIRSGKSVSETAEILGFSNQNYFSASFKRIVGCSPSDFKSD